MSWFADWRLMIRARGGRFFFLVPCCSSLSGVSSSGNNFSSVLGGRVMGAVPQVRCRWLGDPRAWTATLAIQTDRTGSDKTRELEPPVLIPCFQSSRVRDGGALGVWVARSRRPSRARKSPSIRLDHNPTSLYHSAFRSQRNPPSGPSSRETLDWKRAQWGRLTPLRYQREGNTSLVPWRCGNGPSQGFPLTNPDPWVYQPRYAERVEARPA